MITAAVHTEKSSAASAAATTELLCRERFMGSVYEPLKFDSGIIEAVHQHGNAVFTTSIGLLDYRRRDITNIITEPSPINAEAYAHKAVDLATCKVAFLLPLDFMSGKQAKTLFETTPLVRAYVLTNHLTYRSGPMCWMVWEKGNPEPPVIRWI